MLSVAAWGGAAAMSAEQVYRWALERIADAESGVWGRIAHEALREGATQANRSAAITEAELFNGMGVDGMVRSRPVPARLGHVTKPWPR
jgi:hypothetical protein